MPHATKKILNDTKRLQALRQTCLLDSQAEAAFDRLTRLASRIIGVPVSLVSLVDADRQYFKSAVGLDIQQTPLSHSFCQHVVTTGEPLVVEDAREHPLVHDNMAIHDLDVIGYLGLPLSTSDGVEIGSLCVIDSEPRRWTQDEINILSELATSVMMEIELRVKMWMQQEAGRELSLTDMYGSKVSATATQAFGVYRVVEEVGKGGMARVYRCRHKLLDVEVAVKEMLPEHASSPDFVERFKREAEIVSGLKHPNIVRVFGFGMQADDAYMVMEYINGQPLDQLIANLGKLPLQMTLDVLSDVADALDYAHKKDIVHRDIKPANVMLRQRLEGGLPIGDYHATLMDFGIARMGDQQTRLTSDSTVGTLDYIAPEQLQNLDELDGRADIYGLGVMAYQMLTGKLPIKGNSVAQLIYAHLQDEPVRANVLNPAIPSHIAEAIQQALAKDPNDRPQTANEFIQMLVFKEGHTKAV